MQPKVYIRLLRPVTLLLAGLVWLACLPMQAQTASPGVVAYVDVLNYRLVEGPTMVEIQQMIDGRSVPFEKQGQGYVGRVLVTMAILRDTQIVFADKYRLASRPVADTTLSADRFRAFPLQVRRVKLPEGQYRLRVAFQAEAAPTLPVTLDLTEFEVEPTDTTRAAFSDVFFTERISQAPADADPDFVRYGLQMVPYVRNAAFIEQDTLRYYVEAYHSSKLPVQPHYVSVSLQPVGSLTPLSRFTQVFRPRKGKPLEVYSGKMDLRDLPSDTYYLVVQAHSNDGKVLLSQRRKIFQYNSREMAQASAEAVDLYDRNYGYPEAELKDYVQSLVYIASESERQFLKALKTYPELKNFFVNFWEKRKQNPSQVENITWPEYRERFLYANQQFKAGLRKGWSTDRGRTLMLYGPPTDIQDLSNEQELYPHQIWTYNTLRNQNGVIFVFYDPGMGSNLYQLIHSTLRGEPFNGGWRAQIQKARGPRSPDYLYEGEQRGNPFQFYDDKVLPGVSTGVPR